MQREHERDQAPSRARPDTSARADFPPLAPVPKSAIHRALLRIVRTFVAYPATRTPPLWLTALLALAVIAGLVALVAEFWPKL